MKDFPDAQHVSILERGAMIGEEDIYRKTHSSTLTCHTQKGTLLVFPRMSFMKLKRLDVAWDEVLHQMAYRKFR